MFSILFFDFIEILFPYFVILLCIDDVTSENNMDGFL